MGSENGSRTAYSNGGMVATAHYDASRIGAQILDKGGNAFDAAVAAGFALGVCEPNASGIGGGGFMTAHCAAEKRNIFVDFREVAPASAKPSMWKIGEDGEVIGKEKEEGGKSICVPGEVAGLCYILEKYGTMSLQEVMEPAIKLAQEGVVISEALLNDLKSNYDKFARFAENGNVFLKDYKVGEHLPNPELANTLSRIAKEGAEAFYRSDLTDIMIKSINKHGGNFTKEDFASFKVRELTPVSGSYRGYDIISSPPPSSGGTHIIEILNILENFEVGKLAYHSEQHIHLLSEVFKMCFADRARYMGDPDFVKIPLKGLLSKEYAAKRAGSYYFDKIEPAEHDDPFKFESCDTTHFSIADKYGNVVAITKSISAFFGSGVVPENTGVIMNCQMRCFFTGEDKNNSVGGGKKPLSSMSPTIILKDGKPFAVLGTPGGNRIISTMAQVISNLIDFGMDMESAIGAPRFYNDVMNLLHYEARIDEESIKKLEDKGQECIKLKDWDRFFGGVQGIFYQNRKMVGVADPRRDGRVVGCQ
ncbi:MAG: gamma-glutamyltransferase [Lutispora sp.]|jgi:gamma-glutamyltranspeptidase/glutathione hydrolase